MPVGINMFKKKPVAIEQPLTRKDLEFFALPKGEVIVRIRINHSDDWYVGILKRNRVLKGCLYLSLKPLAHYDHVESHVLWGDKTTPPLFNDEEIPIRKWKRYRFLFGGALKVSADQSAGHFLVIKTDHENIVISSRECDIKPAKKLLGIEDSNK